MIAVKAEDLGEFSANSRTLPRSHASTHSTWKVCSQGRRLRTAPDAYDSRHTAHTASLHGCAHAASVGSAATAALRAAAAFLAAAARSDASAAARASARRLNRRRSILMQHMRHIIMITDAHPANIRKSIGLSSRPSRFDASAHPPTARWPQVGELGGGGAGGGDSTALPAPSVCQCAGSSQSCSRRASRAM